MHEPAEKVVSKVATLFGILEQLGFTAARIQECLEKVKVLELDDCMDWLFLHCDAEELACEGPIDAKVLQATSIDPASTPATTATSNGDTPTREPATSPPSPNQSTKRSPAPPSLPVSPRQPRSRTTTSSSTPAPAPPAQTNKEVASTFADLRARILAAEDKSKKKQNKADKKKRTIISAARDGDSSDSDESSASSSSAASLSSSDDEDSEAELTRSNSTKEPTPSTPASETEAEDDEGEEDALSVDSNARYASLKLKLSEIQRAQGASKRAGKGKGDRKGGAAMTKPQEEWIEGQAEQLRTKIKAIETDYTFRKVDAEKLYREERTKLDAAQLSARLNGTTLEPVLPQFPSSIATPAAEQQTAPATAPGSSPPSPSVAHGASNGSGPAAEGADPIEEGGFFGNLLEETPTEETTEQGTTIPIRDLSLPKHFSGKTPKVSLEETVRKLDKPATVKFMNHQRGSRAVRASVTIRWSDARVQQWDMDDVACSDQPQAFNYVATIALFAIANQTAVNKQLPTVFRDLWDELVAKKKEEDEGHYREKLMLYKQIAEPRLQEQGSKVCLAHACSLSLGIERC